MNLEQIINALSLLALAGLAVGIVVIGVDTVRQVWAWQPPHVDIPPGYRILQRPFDYERDG